VPDDLSRRFQGTVFVCVNGGLTKIVQKGTVFVRVCQLIFQISPKAYYSALLFFTQGFSTLPLLLSSAHSSKRAAIT